MGVISRLANERSLNMTVDQTAQGSHTFEKLVEIGRKLLKDGADVLILGCAGMASHRSKLQKELHVPIIDPTQAAVSMALGYLVSH
jgi:Asp/Glu/hydantoin racemase